MIIAHPERFFAALRSGLLGPTLERSEVDGCNAILEALKDWPLAWTAYGLATSYHETAHSMQPAKEIGGESYFRRMYDPQGLRPEVAAMLGNTQPGDGVLFAGRGFVQLTGRANYARADRELGMNGAMIADPDHALEPPIAAAVMERGMRLGWFTGRKLDDFLPPIGPATRAQFIAARWVINRQDRADMIADFALRFEDALMAAQGA